MVLAVAALLLQFHAFQPVAPTTSMIPADTTNSAAEISLATSALPAAPAAIAPDYVASAGESSSARMNLTAVHFDSADSKTHIPGTLTPYRSTPPRMRNRFPPFAFRRRLPSNMESRKR